MLSSACEIQSLNESIAIGGVAFVMYGFREWQCFHNGSEIRKPMTAGAPPEAPSDLPP
jgi:hypothetical protein